MVSRQVLIEHSLRNIGEVTTEVKEKVVKIIELAYKEKIYVQFSSGYRSMEEQAKLYGQGRPGYTWQGRTYGHSGKIVTNAKPGQSIHNYGLAVDYFIVSDDGTKAFWKVDKRWRRVAEIAKTLGFVWGGEWKSFKDYPHLELTRGRSWQEMKAGKSSGKDIGLLERGSEGKAVKELQNDLCKLGYQLNKWGCDGVFGEETARAVQQFQAAYQLETDGIAGEVTRRKLAEVISLRQGIQAVIPYPGFPIKSGSKGINVKRIQRAVHVTPDGVYGAATTAAVKEYQKRHNLEVDGVVGPLTWNVMF
ncbi:peptidoglycan-binding protein [Halobacillus salinarum]|uniref:Peptidoglycan-binding protein n=1 Tax=Halobacillus salinarum TaxID=2932257 RepID=A0ABY4EN94_9BACI|nr:peptidoglycan-binding protein [Halobacillus salinarum]UOQ45664.1 peptidoglycan-binding protein [Halobacillus salinarum]